MCIIVVKPYDKVLSRETLYNCWERNDDGGGIAFIDKSTKEMTVYKELRKFKRFYNLYKKAEINALEKTAIVLHFRIATHGNICEENIHPFKLPNHDLLLFHNGIIPVCELDSTGKRTNLSDTGAFAKYYLNEFPKDFHKNSIFCWFIEEAIDSNKLVLFDSTGYFKIINESLGYWDKESGCWFSNQSYKYKKIKNSIPFSKTGASISNLPTTTVSDVKVICPSCSKEYPKRLGYLSRKLTDKYVCYSCHLQETPVFKPPSYDYTTHCCSCKKGLKATEGIFYSDSGLPYCSSCWNPKGSFHDYPEYNPIQGQLGSKESYVTCDSCGEPLGEDEVKIYKGAILCEDCLQDALHLFEEVK